MNLKVFTCSEKTDFSPDGWSLTCVFFCFDIDIPVKLE